VKATLWLAGAQVVSLAADCGVQSPFRQWAAANCAVLPTANAGRYTVNFSCNWQLF